MLPFFVGGLLKDTGDPANGLAVLIGEKVDCLRRLVVVIVLSEDLELVRIEGRDEVGIVLIEPEGEVDEFPLLFG